MSLGARWAGVEVSLAVERNAHAAATYAKNHPTTKVLCADVATISQIPVIKNDEPRVLFGGPPCQGFSTSNQRTRNIANKSNWLFREFTRLVQDWYPEWVIFENVRGIAQTEGGRFLEEVQISLQRSGYEVAEWILDAAEFGVPQRRSRLFLVGCRIGHVPAPPIPQGGVTVKVGEAILEDLPLLQNGAATDMVPYSDTPRSAYSLMMRGGMSECSNHLVSRNAEHIIERYRHVPQGGNWEDIPAALMKNYRDRTRCHTGIYRRLRVDMPSVVVGNFRKNMLIHPTQDRGLSVREAARLQSFPDSYTFLGSIGLQQQQVGNAVPPMLARAVFSRITGSLACGPAVEGRNG
jgi:DNA (cytosine-5)-methyltransferase 1